MNNTYNRILDLVVQIEEGYTTGGPGTGHRVGKYIKRMEQRHGLTKKKQTQAERIFKKVVTKKTKSTDGRTPSRKTQERRADTFRTGASLGATGSIHKDSVLKQEKNKDLRKDEGNIGDLVQKVKDRVTREGARWNKAQGKAQDSVTGRGSFNKDPNAPFGRNNKGKPRKGPDNGRQ
tara:strand:- start:45 stop:575 length:531 start_codon:yes stop_codon:yes gene_type:complete